MEPPAPMDPRRFPHEGAARGHKRLPVRCREPMLGCSLLTIDTRPARCLESAPHGPIGAQLLVGGWEHQGKRGAVPNRPVRGGFRGRARRLNASSSPRLTPTQIIDRRAIWFPIVEYRVARADLHACQSRLLDDDTFVVAFCSTALCLKGASRGSIRDRYAPSRPIAPPRPIVETIGP
jgi:hypothetical protein